MVDFDIEDDLDSTVTREEVAAEAPPKVFISKCPKCRGTGIYHGFSSRGSRCFKCDGRGSLTFATSDEDRAKARTRSKAKKESTKISNVEGFSADHPRIAAWWNGSTFDFAISMREAVEKFGSLTENQLAAAYRCVDKVEAAKKDAEERRASAQDIDVGRIEVAFALAFSKGVKKPKMRLGAFVFSRAPESGRNAGSLYVVEKESDTYIGKVSEGKFFRASSCSVEVEAEVIRLAGNPKDSAIAYGRRTGSCAICGRELTDGTSIDRGIGPICADKFGW